MDVRDTISGIMNLPKTEIGNISEVKKGMTNQSFLFSCDGEEYILRIPGVGTSMLIDRKREAAVYNVLKDSDICDHIIYFNKETGYKISRFYRNACVCNAGNDNDAKRCMIFLRNFHQRKYCVEHSFDLWERINYYESLWTKQTIYEDYNSVKKRVLQLKKYVDMQKKESCLCHIDAVPDNFLLVENEIHLIDWEYAGDGDIALELAAVWIDPAAHRRLAAEYARQASIDEHQLWRQIQRWRPWVQLLMAGWYERRWQQTGDRQFIALADEIWRQLDKK